MLNFSHDCHSSICSFTTDPDKCLDYLYKLQTCVDHSCPIDIWTAFLPPSHIWSTTGVIPVMFVICPHFPFWSNFSSSSNFPCNFEIQALISYPSFGHGNCFLLQPSMWAKINSNTGRSSMPCLCGNVFSVIKLLFLSNGYFMSCQLS